MYEIIYVYILRRLVYGETKGQSNTCDLCTCFHPCYPSQINNLSDLKTLVNENAVLYNKLLRKGIDFFFYTFHFHHKLSYNHTIDIFYIIMLQTLFVQKRRMNSNMN